jgi:elongation factor P
MAEFRENSMYTAADLRKGLKVQVDGAPYIISEFEFSKPGKGQALYRCKMRNMITGNQLVQTYRSNDKFEKPELEERKMQYLYCQGEEYHFMDTQNYEQIVIDKEHLGDSVNYMIDNMEMEVLFFQDKPIDVSLPMFVNLQVTQADPWAKGDTSGSDSKPVTVETAMSFRSRLLWKRVTGSRSTLALGPMLPGSKNKMTSRKGPNTAVAPCLWAFALSHFHDHFARNHQE